MYDDGNVDIISMWVCRQLEQRRSRDQSLDSPTSESSWTLPPSFFLIFLKCIAGVWCHMKQKPLEIVLAEEFLFKYQKFLNLSDNDF